MKALFLSLPLHGHTNPTLQLVRELTAGGDQVVYYSVPEFAAGIEQTGAQYRPYRCGLLPELKQIPERVEELPWLLLRTTAEMLRDELDAWRAEKPGYVIADSVAPWGQWAAKLLDVPVVTSVATLAGNRHVMLYAAAHGVRPNRASRPLNKLRSAVKAALVRRRLIRQYGVRGPGIMGSVMGSSDLNIVYTSRYFQPCAQTFDSRFQFVGPSIAARSQGVGFPWDQVRHTVVVYISLGTLFNADDVFYRNCYQAFRGEDCQVILSAGANVSPDHWGPPPANFIVRSHVPQLEVLVRASAFVTHGGMNSVNEGLAHGVPLLVIPQMGEQMIIGRRVEELGAGLFLSKTQVTAEALRQAVRQLLDGPGFRDSAARVRESFQNAGGVTRAAEAIRAFTRRQP